MGWFGFPFKSREQVEKEQRQFHARILPYGEEERSAVLGILAKLTAPRLKEEARLFAFLNAKDAYLEAMADPDGPMNPLQAARQSMSQQKWLSARDKAVIVALVHLEHSIDSLEEFPSSVQVDDLAHALISED